jgi:hypothetical protein
VWPLSLEAYMFHNCDSVYLGYRMPGSYVAVYCVPYDAVADNSDIVR